MTDWAVAGWAAVTTMKSPEPGLGGATEHHNLQVTSELKIPSQG